MSFSMHKCKKFSSLYGNEDNFIQHEQVQEICLVTQTIPCSNPHAPVVQPNWQIPKGNTWQASTVLNVNK